MLVNRIFSFFRNVFNPSQKEFLFLIYIYFVVCHPLNLDLSKILLFGKELRKNNHKIRGEKKCIFLFAFNFFKSPLQLQLLYPHERNGGGYTGVSLFVSLSVHPCVTKYCLGHNFKCIKASNFKLHTQIGHIVEKCRTITLFHYLWSYYPL